MADLDAVTGGALCRSLERVLSVELGMPVGCIDISGRSERWDVEAHDAAGSLVRRVSHTQTVPEPMARAGAELRDVRKSADAEMASLGVTGVGLSFHGRALPENRRDRQGIGRMLAQRVQTHLVTGAPIIEDPIDVVMSGRHPDSDPLAAAIADVGVFPITPDKPARIHGGGDDRWISVVPELFEEVLPAIARKKVRHGGLTSDLTLVVQPVTATISRAAVRKVAEHLEAEHLGFRSVYVGKLASGRFPLKRIY